MTSVAYKLSIDLFGRKGHTGRPEIHVTNEIVSGIDMINSDITKSVIRIFIHFGNEELIVNSIQMEHFSLDLVSVLKIVGEKHSHRHRTRHRGQNVKSVPHPSFACMLEEKESVRANDK